MTGALPPLQFLHALEAASRLGSFRAAASELHVTPSAISQQIHAVEEALGVPLFTRSGRNVQVTPDGALYCQEVRRTLAELTDAGRRLSSRSKGSVLRISTVDFLAHEFLIPRLPAFQRLFPGIELRIETSMHVVDLEQSEIDCALRVHGKPKRGLWSETIGDATGAIVCAPSRAKHLRSPEDLCSETLLEMGASAEGIWQELMRARGFEDRSLRIMPLESYFQTMTAAERGLGAAIGLFPMTTAWVESGRLAVPFRTRSPIEGGVYLVFRATDKRRELFLGIASFLRREYASLPRLAAGRIVPGEGSVKPKSGRPRPIT